MVEKRQTNKQITEHIKHIISKRDLDKNQSSLLKQISEQTWFRQYAKQSRAQTIKITDKIVKGIEEGKYTYAQKQKDHVRGADDKIIKQTKRKIKKRKAQKKKIEHKIAKSQKKLPIKTEISKTHAPSGRKYSPTELREGLGSKRAREWRIRNKIDVTDFKKRR